MMENVSVALEVPLSVVHSYNWFLLADCHRLLVRPLHSELQRATEVDTRFFYFRKTVTFMT